MSHQLKYLPALEEHQEHYNLPVQLTYAASPPLAIALVVLALTMSVPGMHAITSNPIIAESYLKFLLIVSYALPGCFLLFLSYRALCKADLVVSKDSAHLTRGSPLFGERQWTEPLSNYQGLMVELSSGSAVIHSTFTYAAVLIHQTDRNKNLTLMTSTSKSSFYRSVKILAKQLSLVLLTETSEAVREQTTTTDHADSFDGTGLSPTSEFEHIFVEPQTSGNGVTVKCFHRQSAFFGAALMFIGSTILLLAHALHSPLWSLVSIPLTLFGLLTVCRGLFIYDYLNISKDTVSRGVSLFGYVRQQGAMKSGEIENITIAMPDDSRRNAVQVVGETKIICFGESASSEEREWIRSLIAELLGQDERREEDPSDVHNQVQQ